MEKFKTSSVKGTEDIAPKKMIILENMLNTIKKVYAQNGFNQIQTPILENLELLSKGDSGDNSKMMFKTVKRGAKLDLTKPNLTENDIVEEGLRYDLTVPLCRFYADNINDLPKPFKSFQIGESFRAEKPQKGRYREFTQCDIDVFGEPTVLAEIEILTTVMQTYKKLGIKDVVIKVNDRRILNGLITKAGFDKKSIPSILISVDKYDKIGRQGIYEELVSSNFDKKQIETLLKALDDISINGLVQCTKYGVDEEIINSLNTLLEVSNNNAPAGYKVEYDAHIIRGQGYYTGTVFEAFCQSSSLTRAIGGGGRYDSMLDRFVNMPVHSVGWGLGLIPCLIILEENNVTFENQNKKVAILYKSENRYNDLIKCKLNLMKKYSVSLMPEPKNYQAFIVKMQNIGYDGIYKFWEDKLIWF